MEPSSPHHHSHLSRSAASFDGTADGVRSPVPASGGQGSGAMVEQAQKSLSPQMYRAISPPTPAQSPQPHVPTLLMQSAHPSAPSPPPEPVGLSSSQGHTLLSLGDAGSDAFKSFHSSFMSQFSFLPPSARLELLDSIVAACDTREIAHLTSIAAPLLKVDFFAVLPIEVSLYILSFIDDPQTLARASQVSRFWRSLVNDEHTWKAMCAKHQFRSLPPLSRSFDGRATSISTEEESSGDRQYGEADDTSTEDEEEIGTQVLASLYQRYRARGLDPSNALHELRTLHDLFLSKQEAEASSSGRRRRDTVMSDADRAFYAELEEIVSEESEARYGARELARTVGDDERMYDGSMVPSSTDQEHLGWLSAGPHPLSPTSRSTPVIVRPSQTTTEQLARHTAQSGEEHMDVDPASDVEMDARPFDSSRPRDSIARLSAIGSSSSATASGLARPKPFSGPGSKPQRQFSYKTHFKYAYLTESNWLRGGRMLTQHTSSETGAVVTSLAMDSEWIVVGMANAKIHVFDARTGLFSKTLQGHESGVWCIGLVSRTARSISPGAEAERAEADRRWGNKGGTALDALWSKTRLVNNGGDLVLSQHDERPTASAFLPDESPATAATGSSSQSDSEPAGNESSYHARANLSSDQRKSFDLRSNLVHHGLDQSVEALRSGSGLLPDVDETLEWFHRARRVIELRNSRSSGNLSQTASSDPTDGRRGSVGTDDRQRNGKARETVSTEHGVTDGPMDGAGPEAEAIAEREAGSIRDAIMRGDASAAMAGISSRQSERNGSPASGTNSHDHIPHGDSHRYRRGSRHVRMSQAASDDEDFDPYRVYVPGYKATPSAGLYDDQDGSESRPDPSVLGGNAAGLGNPCGSSRGYGNRDALIVSGGCDRDIRVWDLHTGKCKFIMRGHSSTVRCLKVLDGRAIAVTGSRDSTLRVWDIARGQLLHVLAGHIHSVRCVEVAGTKVVSGSYDGTARVWDVITGECLHVLRGHYNHIYAVAFDGNRIATGSLDSTVRIWEAATGKCQAILQGHTSLVGQLQLTDDILLTGGSDGRVIIFCLRTMQCLHRLCAHDHSVTCLQFDHRFIVTGGNDGRVKLWNTKTGAFIRELCQPSEAVWKITYRDDKCVILCKREGRTSMDVITFRPVEGS